MRAIVACDRSNAEKASTTKDTKYHEGLRLWVFPLCDFVSFVVEVFKTDS